MICPLARASPILAEAECMRERCAWWDVGGLNCAVLTMAINLCLLRLDKLDALWQEPPQRGEKGHVYSG